MASVVATQTRSYRVVLEVSGSNPVPADIPGVRSRIEAPVEKKRNDKQSEFILLLDELARRPACWEAACRHGCGFEYLASHAISWVRVVV